MHPTHAEYYVRLKNRLKSAGQGERGNIIAEASGFLGCGNSTVYRKLAQVGWTSGRKTRSDRGRLCVDEALVVTAAGMMQAATRANGKRTLPLTAVVEILEKNGRGVVNQATGEITMPSPATMARAMRALGCHPDQVGKGSPAQTLRSLHPNHTWQMDASVCVLFYLKNNKAQVMAEDTFYKNKPHNLKKIENKRVIRWVITDHYSGAIFARYTLGTEDAAAAISVLIEGMCRREYPQDIFHGAPAQLYTDKGAPFVAGMMKAFLKRLNILPLEHAAGNARATGQVEHAQNIIETQFEGRLRFLDVDSLESLNRHLNDWLVMWNAGAVHRRHGKTRNQVWMQITKEQLRVPESVEALRAIVAAPPETRKVNPRLILDFAPKGYGPHSYRLSDIDGIAVGQSIGVSVNPYEAPAVDVIITAANGDERVYTLQPVRRNCAGFDLTAPVIGQEIRSLKDTATDKAVKRMEREAYGTTTHEEAKKAKKAGRRAYTDINIMADVQAAKVSLYFPKQGKAVITDAPVRQLPPLNLAEAAIRLKSTLEMQGVPWTSEHMAHLSRNYPAGVSHEALEALGAEFLARTETAQLARSMSFASEATPLRTAVGGAV